MSKEGRGGTGGIAAAFFFFHVKPLRNPLPAQDDLFGGFTADVDAAKEEFRYSGVLLDAGVATDAGMAEGCPESDM